MCNCFFNFGDGNKGKIKGKGIVSIPGFPSLDDVLYVKGLKANLLSIGQFCDGMHEVKFSKECCSIFNPSGQCIVKGSRSTDNCYCIETLPSTVCNRVLLDDVELWHQRLGHVNFSDLHRITKHEIVRGVPKLANGNGLICGGCMKGKQTKAPHKKTNVVGTSRCLELDRKSVV